MVFKLKLETRFEANRLGVRRVDLQDTVDNITPNHAGEEPEYGDKQYS